jgi:hypothetical protein
VPQPYRHKMTLVVNGNNIDEVFIKIKAMYNEVSKAVNSAEHEYRKALKEYS